MKVVKIGGSSLKDSGNIAHILDLIGKRGRGHIFVLSALNGVTDMLLASMSDALQNEGNIPGILGRLQEKHWRLAQQLAPGKERIRKIQRLMRPCFEELERFYYGLNFTREITPRLRDVISSYGEQLAVQLLFGLLGSRGVEVSYRLSQHIGLITDGKFGDSTVKLKQTAANLQDHLLPLVAKGRIVLLPGFYGISEDGDITTFGRGGSDYAAAAIAVALGADILEIWKDVPGFMSSDPKIVPEAQLIPALSYEEAAELSYFGARILHPRTVEPLRRSGLEIVIKSTMDPDGPGSVIKARSPRPKHVIKSVAYNAQVGIIKVHASGVGARPGILARVAARMTERGINIKSVVTSQTSITLLLASDDLEAGYRALQTLRPRPYRRLEKNDDVALVGIVGEGLARRKGIAARCFEAVANCGVNVEMISFGPSRVALYFLVRARDLHKTVAAIHSSFFSIPRCF
ncbi:MAG: aspartate kinase [Deltaproteobacteria bacterium]|nr:aspartate kinase [Deltaproteobacteria bacterium]MBW2069813.1 aspartate kinase [Deltaproteobacteria bacterium]